MPSAATLRLQIERFLEDRFPAALSPAPRTRHDLATTGIGSIDALLHGGLPVGAISEITGPASSGCTSLTLAFVARRTAEGSVCAWVDANDALDPASAAANGVALPQLLWVRCRDNAAPACQVPAYQPRPFKIARVWTRLDQALRATDLLLQAGGFAAIVLDLGMIAREQASRIPLATWFRFRQASGRSRCSLIVLGEAAYAQSSAEAVLECAPLSADHAGGAVLHGFTATARRLRERFAPVEIGTPNPGTPTAGLRRGKPPVSTWSADAQWVAEKRA